MTKVHLNLKDQTIKSTASNDSVSINECNDGNTIKKVKSLSIPTHESTSSSMLAGRVTKNAATPQLDIIKNEMTALAATKPSNEPNYMIRLQNLISLLLAQFIKISAQERTQKDGLETKYSKKNLESGDLDVKMGNRQFVFTFISFGLTAAQFLFTNRTDQEIISQLAGKIGENTLGMMNASTRSDQKQLDANSQLLYTKMNDIINKGSANSSNQNDIIQFLKTLYDLLVQAARGN